MGGSIRVMTSNLLYGGADVDGFREVLDRVEPDVVVTQELGHGYVEVLTERFPNHSLHPADDFTGRGIATHLDVEFGSIAMPVRPGTSAILDVAGQQWDLAGVHLVNPIDFPWWTSVKVRGEQLQAIEQWGAKRSGQVLIAGDFNASPRWPAYRLMAERWTDLVAEHASASGRRPELTWAWRPGWRRMLRIDHVFGSGLVATDSEVVPIRGSDHAAVWVDVVTG
jgi:endonuclease/exonuclease/phosphatase (EEP) superfamily protein YafD